MLLQKLRSDSSIELEHDISYDEFIDKTRRIQEKYSIYALFSVRGLLRPLYPEIKDMCLTYLKGDGENKPNIMGKREVEGFIKIAMQRLSQPHDEDKDISGQVALHVKCLREMIKITLVTAHADDIGVRPTVESFYDIEEEKLKYYREKKSSDSTIKSNDSNSNIDQSENDVRIFSPILPYPVGGVIATADVIFKCSRKSDETEHLFRWQFESCISSEKYDWLSTDLVYLAPSLTNDQ